MMDKTEKWMRQTGFLTVRIGEAMDRYEYGSETHKVLQQLLFDWAAYVTELDAGDSDD